VADTVIEARGCFMLLDGEVFVASEAPHRLDGRYLGPTPIIALTAQAIPLVTWRSRQP
jgi:type IV secretory pathway protease TraF